MMPSSDPRECEDCDPIKVRIQARPCMIRLADASVRVADVNLCGQLAELFRGGPRCTAALLIPSREVRKVREGCAACSRFPCSGLRSLLNHVEPVKIAKGSKVCSDRNCRGTPTYPQKTIHKCIRRVLLFSQRGHVCWLSVCFFDSLPPYTISWVATDCEVEVNLGPGPGWVAGSLGRWVGEADQVDAFC